MTTAAFDVETDPSLATVALHAGTGPDPATGALLTPILSRSSWRVGPTPGLL